MTDDGNGASPIPGLDLRVHQRTLTASCTRQSSQWHMHMVLAFFVIFCLFYCISRPLIIS
jgi:hypothetical protein